MSHLSQLDFLNVDRLQVLHRGSGWGSLSSAEASAGYPYKNSNNRKNRKCAADDGKREKARSFLLSFPFPSYTPSTLFLPSFPTTRRGLYEGERLELCFSKRLCHKAGAHNWKRTTPMRYALLARILLLGPVLYLSH